LSHDVLKNEVMPLIAKLHRVLSGEVDAPDFLAEFDSEGASKVDVACDEFDALIKSAEADLSPKTLFDIPPLSECPPETTCWLPEAVHHRWMVEHRVPKRVKDGLTLSNRVRRTLRDWRRARSKSSQADAQMVAIRLRSELSKLSTFVSSLADLPPYRL